MPALTVKALAEFAEKPVADQMRILAEQKRPSAGAAQFKKHYYSPTRTAIRRFYGRSNDPAVLAAAIKQVRAGAGPGHRCDHNERAIQAFGSCGALTQRTLMPANNTTYTITYEGVDVRLHPDLEAHDGTTTKYCLVNYTIVSIDSDIARRTLELMYWLLNDYGLSVAISDCEIIDLVSGTVITEHRRCRVRTTRNAMTNLRAIHQLWPII